MFYRPTQELGREISQKLFPGNKKWLDFPGFVQMVGIILKNSSQGNVLQTHPGIGKGNFPKTLPRQALVIGFSLDTAGGEKLKKKLFQGKCFVEQGIEKGNIPKTLPRPREEIVIGFPLHTGKN